MIHARHVAVVLIAGADFAHRHLTGLDLGTVLKQEGDLDRLARHDWFLHAHQHEVLAAWLEFCGATGRNLQAALLFLHYTVNNLVHLVHLGVDGGAKASDGDVLVGIVMDGAEDGSHLRILSHGANHAVLDGDIACLLIGGACACRSRAGCSFLFGTGILLAVGAASQPECADGNGRNNDITHLHH